MRVGRACAGQRAARGGAHGVRVVLVFDPQAGTERRIEEVGDIAGREDVRRTRPEHVVHDNPVFDTQSRLFGKLDIGLNAEAGDDDVGGDLFPVRRPHDHRAGALL